MVFHKLKKTALFHKTKAFLFHKPFILLSKAILFCPPLPISTPLNLLSAKNTAFLLISALNPHAVKPEPRTDSKPFRHRFVRKTGFGSCRRKYLQKYFRQSFESSPGVERAAALRVLLVLFVQAKRIKPFSLQRTLRFCKPRINPTKQQLRTNKIKTFPKGDSRFCKPRISTQNYNFAQAQLNPLPLRGNSYFL